MLDFLNRKSRATTMRKNNRKKFDMHVSLRCGAKTRSGKACLSPAVAGKRRCRMHGGAEGSGAPEGNTNALKHGRYTKEAIKRRRAMTQMLRIAKKLYGMGTPLKC
jgi:hypothetical protein